MTRKFSGMEFEVAINGGPNSATWEAVGDGGSLVALDGVVASFNGVAQHSMSPSLPILLVVNSLSVIRIFPFVALHCVFHCFTSLGLAFPIAIVFMDIVAILLCLILEGTFAAHCICHLLQIACFDGLFFRFKWHPRIQSSMPPRS